MNGVIFSKGAGVADSVFGKSHIDEIAKEFSLPVLAKLPMDPNLAQLCDDGKLEQSQGDWLNAAADAVEALK